MTNTTVDDEATAEAVTDQPAPDPEEVAEQLADMLFDEVRPVVVRFAKILIELSPSAPTVDLSQVHEAKRPAPEEAPARASRERIDEDAIIGAVVMVHEERAKDVAPNVLLAAKRRGLVVSVRRGHYGLSPAGEEVLAAAIADS